MSDYRRIFETGETIAADPADLGRALERLRRPGGNGTAVNVYPGPLLYEVAVWLDPWAWAEPLPWGARRYGPVRGCETRDANHGWGMWWQTARLPHVPVNTATIGLRVIEADYKSRFADMPGLWVPCYEGDPERRTWRRRKWWGRGPIHFDPTGLRRGAAPVPFENVRTGDIVWGEVIYAPRSFGLAEIIRGQGEVDR